MGKLTIISSNNDGSYTATVEYDTTVIAAMVAKLTTKIADFQTIIDDSESTDQEVAVAKIRQLSASKRRSYFQNISKVPANYNITAWCADYTTDLTGSVGSIEIGTEIANGCNIQPGYDSNAVYSGVRDGQLVPAMALSGAGHLYNLCMLPGAQKWRPRHRYGVITDIDYDADTCDITLDALTSSQQGLNINQEISYTDVPIEYMDCNSAAFAINDRVIVEFASVEPFPATTQKVIGFESTPQPCACYWTEEFDGPSITTKNALILTTEGRYTDWLNPPNYYSLLPNFVSQAQLSATFTTCTEPAPQAQNCSHFDISIPTLPVSKSSYSPALAEDIEEYNHTWQLHIPSAGGWINPNARHVVFNTHVTGSNYPDSPYHERRVHMYVSGFDADSTRHHFNILAVETNGGGAGLPMIWNWVAGVQNETETDWAWHAASGSYVRTVGNDHIAPIALPVSPIYVDTVRLVVGASETSQGDILGHTIQINHMGVC